MQFVTSIFRQNRGMVMAGFILLCLTHLSPAVAETKPTEVVVLGVEHSLQLAAPQHRAAVMRAFVDKLKPAAICVERAPERFARNDHYEFTYEIQDVLVPYARERGIPLCPFDWLPSRDDQLLGFGLDLETPPAVRPREGFQAFITFPDVALRSKDFFFADSDDSRAEGRAFYGAPAPAAHRDIARRLFLYRTFMQARHVQAAARAYPNGPILVVVGRMHKEDIEQIVGASPQVKIRQPSDIGLPSPTAIAAHDRPEDLFAIATFNLLGAQSGVKGLDLAWLQQVVDKLQASHPGNPEAELLAVRLQVLTGRLAPRDAAARYRAIADRTEAGRRFTYDGVLDRRRLDSFFDPYGNLGVHERALLEAAREYRRSGDEASAAPLLETVRATLNPQQALQLDGYWALN